MKKKNPWFVLYLAALALFTGYVMLDTFVIPRAGNTNAGEINSSMFDDEESSATVPSSSARSGSGSKRQKGDQRKKTDSSRSGSITTHSGDYTDYSDDNITVKMKEYTENNTKIYVADVTLSSAKYLKTAFANDTYGKNITATTSDIASAKGAILAINGDTSGTRENGYVIRNGIIYRDIGNDDTDVLCIYTDGHFEITNSREKTAAQLLDENVWQAFSFGPALVKGGEVSVALNDEVGRAMASNPRTAIGIIDSCHYLFVVSDGRTGESSGLSLNQLAEFMKGLGAETAYNLDGGGSSTMYYNNEIINKPTTGGNSINERKVSDIVYIGY